MTAEFEIVEDPARACAALMVERGGRPAARSCSPAARRRRRPTSIRRRGPAVGMDLRGTTFGSATSVACRPTTSAPTTGWSRSRCSTRCRARPSPTMHRIKGELGPEQGAEDYERELRAAGTRVRSGAARDRARRPHALAVPGQPTLRSARGWSSASGGRPGAVRAAGLADPPALAMAPAGRVPRRGRVEGRGDRRGVRPGAEPDPRFPPRCWPPRRSRSRCCSIRPPPLGWDQAGAA